MGLPSIALRHNLTPRFHVMLPPRHHALCVCARREYLLIQPREM